MNNHEFCNECKHHYSFHQDGEGKCEKLYPPRKINPDLDTSVVYDNVNFCYCVFFEKKKNKGARYI